MRLAWIALCALVWSALAATTGPSAATVGASASDRFAVVAADEASDDADQLLADADDDDDDDDVLDDAALAAPVGRPASPADAIVLAAHPVIAPLVRLATAELFRPPRFSSV